MNSAKQSAREKRIARDAKREEVRSALRFGAQYGYYVFDELVTEEVGTLDYLAVGAHGVCAIIVREEEGHFIEDPYTFAWYFNGYPFEDDPRQQKIEMTDDVKTKLPYARPPHATEVSVGSMICLSNGVLHGNNSNEPYRGITDLMTMPLVIFGQGEHKLTPEDIDEIARTIEKGYGRPPFVRPGQSDGGSTI